MPLRNKETLLIGRLFIVGKHLSCPQKNNITRRILCVKELFIFSPVAYEREIVFSQRIIKPLSLYTISTSVLKLEFILGDRKGASHVVLRRLGGPAEPLDGSRQGLNVPMLLEFCAGVAVQAAPGSHHAQVSDQCCQESTQVGLSIYLLKSLSLKAMFFIG